MSQANGGASNGGVATPAEKVAAYIKLRDYKRAAEEEFKKSLDKVTQALEKLENELLDCFNQTGLNSVKCDAGTAYRNEMFSASVEDPTVFMANVKKFNLWDALDVRANKTFVKKFIEEHGEPIPGVKVSVLHKVGVRRA